MQDDDIRMKFDSIAEEVPFHVVKAFHCGFYQTNVIFGVFFRIGYIKKPSWIKRKIVKWLLDWEWKENFHEKNKIH